MHKKYETTGRSSTRPQRRHFAGRAFAAALVVMAASPASAQCVSEGRLCAIRQDDLGGNGIQDAGEPSTEGHRDRMRHHCRRLHDHGSEQALVSSLPDILPPGTYQITIDSTLPPLGPGTAISPQGQGTDATIDSDGHDSGTGLSSASVTVLDTFTFHVLDFGFYTPMVQYPGTGTPGYWKKHPEAWPVQNITVGGVTYTKAQAIAWLGKVGKDKTTTMFSRSFRPC
jgi:hypothetical protein